MKINKQILMTATMALLFIGEASAMMSGPNLKGAKGSVLIAAPTAVNGPTNQGVWFLNPKTKKSSLSLPMLPANQVYEGWIVDNCTGKKTSTGIFRAETMIDSDGAGPFAGPLALDFPPFPGSDFVKLGSNLTDGSHVVVITVEPYPDMDPNPSGVAVLKAAIPAEVMVGTSLMFENVAQ